MNWSMLRAIVILPGNVLVIIPAIILWLSPSTPYAYHVSGLNDYQFWLALCLLIPGLGLSIWTSRLFLEKGEGTPAPWDPPRKLVVNGPYRYVRNPMITSVLINLVAESIFFQSWPLLAWTIIFLIGNAIYFPLSEERGLEQRFGASYREYKRNVPRWIPRLTPWQPGH
jgi:protein-S-isoprenylcysteine O-methyltransferase Ste14